jgi:hypothetical protein
MRCLHSAQARTSDERDHASPHEHDSTDRDQSSKSVESAAPLAVGRRWLGLLPLGKVAVLQTAGHAPGLELVGRVQERRIGDGRLLAAEDGGKFESSCRGRGGDGCEIGPANLLGDRAETPQWIGARHEPAPCGIRSHTPTWWPSPDGWVGRLAGGC